MKVKVNVDWVHTWVTSPTLPADTQNTSRAQAHVVAGSTQDMCLLTILRSDIGHAKYAYLFKFPAI